MSTIDPNPSPSAAEAHPHHGSLIYKFGEGYWVRVMTAVAINLLALVTASWAFKNLGAITLPTDHWQAVLRTGETTPPPGQAAELLAPGAQGDTVVIGTARTGAASTGPAGENLARLDAVDMKGKNQVSEARTLRVGTATSAISAVSAVPIFPLFYLQAGVAAVIALLGAALSWRLVARKPSSVEFLISTDNEMRKVNWSTRREILGSTWVVIGACFLVAAVLYAMDAGFARLFQQIRLLIK